MSTTDRNPHREAAEESQQRHRLETLSDQELVLLCQQNLPVDMSAFQELHKRYQLVVLNTCKGILNSVSDAEEVAQDVMIQVLKKIQSFEGRSSFKTWLYTVTRNYCNNRLSKMIRAREGTANYKSFVEVGEDLSSASEWSDGVNELVRESINALTPSDRLVITLKFLKGYTAREIAESLNIGLSAAKMRLYRALDSFKEAYSLRLEGKTVAQIAC